MLRACLYLLFFVPWTLFCTFFAMLSTFIDRSGKTYHRLALLWSRGCLSAAGIRLTVKGAEHLPRGRPLIFMGNHQSYFDIPVLFQGAPLPFNWLAKEELFRIPVFGHSMRAAGYIPINRGNGRDSLKSLHRAAELIQAGRSVAIFPEGTVTGDGRLLPFKRGAFILAAMAGVPIAPFAIKGAFEVHQAHNPLRLRPGMVRIRFSPPIEIDADKARHPTALSEEVRRAIAAGLEQ